MVTNGSLEVGDLEEDLVGRRVSVHGVTAVSTNDS